MILASSIRKKGIPLPKAKIIIHSIHLHSPCNTSHSSHDEKSTSKQASKATLHYLKFKTHIFSLSLSLFHSHPQTSSPASNSRDPQSQFCHISSSLASFLCCKQLGQPTIIALRQSCKWRNHYYAFRRATFLSFLFLMWKWWRALLGGINSFLMDGKTHIS
jgi:hypothetical protein